MRSSSKRVNFGVQCLHICREKRLLICKDVAEIYWIGTKISVSDVNFCRYMPITFEEMQIHVLPLIILLFLRTFVVFTLRAPS